MERILQVGLSENLGGIESYLYNQAKAIDKNKIIYDFLCFPGTNHIPYEDEIKASGGLIHHLRGRKRYLFSYYLGFIKILKKYNYKGIVLNAITLDNVSLLFIAKLFKIPIRIIHSHNGGFENKKLSLKARFLYKINRHLLYWSATDYFACSKLAGKWLFGEKVSFHVIPNAISVLQYRFSQRKRIKIRRNLSISDSAFVIGHLARFARQKNQEFLIDVFHEIHKHNTDTVLLLVGAVDIHNEYYLNVQRKVEEYGLQKCVKFLGMRHDVPDLMQAMDCFVLTSLFEGLPVVGIEAQASGLPCYFSDTISKEVSITNLVTYYSLSTPPAVWAENILLKSKQVVQREQMAAVVAKAGYDVNGVAQKVQKYYLKRIKANSITGDV